MCCNILNPGQASNSLHVVTHFLSLIVLAVMTKSLVMAVNWEINYRMQISVGVSGNILFLLNFLTSLLSNNMSGLQCLASENIWFDKHRYDEAEKCFYEGVNGPSTPQQQVEQAHILLQSKKFNFFRSLIQPKNKAWV